MYSPIDVVADACAILGADAPPSFDADVPGGVAAEAIHRNVVGFLVGIYPFSWARRWFPLSRLAEADVVGFAYAYVLPAESLGPPLRLAEAPSNAPDLPSPPHLLAGSEIWSDAETLWAECKILPGPEAWSATFRLAAVTAIAGELAFALASDRTTRDQLRADAYGTREQGFRGGLLGAAIAEDARATPSRRLPWANPLLTARLRS